MGTAVFACGAGMRALVQSVRTLVRDYGDECGLSPAALVNELIVGVAILISVWCLNTIAVAAVQP